MDIDYDDGEEARAFADEVRAFMEESVLPEERAMFAGRDRRDDAGRMEEAEELLDDLRDEARERGLYAPQMPEELGGQGLDFRQALPAFEEAGRSVLGQRALHIAAPDEGNMHVLEMAGTEEQKERWLEPLVAGEISSAFSMTEPMQGGGSDPKMVQTTAEKDGDHWVIDGHKWWSTQGVEADVFIVVARTNQDAHPYMGTSLFIVPADADGLEVERDVPHMGDTGMSHAEVTYDEVRVPEDNILGAKDGGFAVAQQRLGPARLTHCMRFSGIADRALDIARAYLTEREGFGEPLAEKQGLRFDVAECETRLHAARTMIRHAADAIARGEEARHEVAMTKVFTADVVQDTVDTAVQLCGGNGIGKDLPLADFYENVRAFRIIDGADEVHKRSIARAAFDEDDLVPEEVEHLTRFGEPAGR